MKVRIPVSILFNWILLCAITPAVFGSSLETIFTLKSGTTQGGCDTYKSKMTTWFAENVELAKTGVQLFTDAKAGKEYAKKTLKLFLGIDGKTSARQLSTFKVWIEEILEFLEGILDLDSGKKPRLFCGSGWLEQETWEDWSQRSDGSLKYEDLDCDGKMDVEPIELRNDPEYKIQYKAGNLVPYWSPDLRQYVFEEDYENKGYCLFTESLAGTNSNTNPAAIDLCERAFTNSKNAATLGSRSAELMTLPQLLPRSSTLFHEIFHLVHGTGDTLDASYDLDEILEALKSPKVIPEYKNFDGNGGELNEEKLTNLELVRANPETWVYMCVAYWYTINKGYAFVTGGKGVAI